MIRIDNIQKRFRKLTALNNINASFQKGQVVSLIGPNGSGKTTLLKSILGLVKPDSGNIFFDDEVIDSNVGYRNRIGYMPQIGRYPDNLTVGQLFTMLKDIRGADKGLDEEIFYKFRLDTMLQKSMKSLSGGTRQKVSAALAFLFNPEVLILDEPTAGLDPLSSEILKEKIVCEKVKGKLLLITSHILSDLEELTTHVLYLQDGRAIFYKSIREVWEETGADKLGKAITWYMKNGMQKETAAYLKIAN